MIILLHVGRQVCTRLNAHGVYPKLCCFLRLYLWESAFEGLQPFLLHILTLRGILRPAENEQVCGVDVVLNHLWKHITRFQVFPVKEMRHSSQFQSLMQELHLRFILMRVGDEHLIIFMGNNLWIQLSWCINNPCNKPHLAYRHPIDGQHRHTTQLIYINILWHKIVEATLRERSLPYNTLLVRHQQRLTIDVQLHIHLVPPSLVCIAAEYNPAAPHSCPLPVPMPSLSLFLHKGVGIPEPAYETCV